MSVEVMALVLNSPIEQGATAKLLLVALANHANPDGTSIRPSVETLARYMEASTRTVQRALRNLEAAGFIRVTRKASRARHWTTEYALVLERLAAPGDILSPRSRVTSAPPPGDNGGAPRVTSGVIPGDIAVSPQPSEEQPSEEQPSEPIALRAKNGRKRTPNDDLWDALSAFLEVNPSNTGVKGKWAKGIGLLVESAVTPAEVPELCEMYLRTYRNMDLNPMALAMQVDVLRRNIAHGGPPRAAPDDPVVRTLRGEWKEQLRG